MIIWPELILAVQDGGGKFQRLHPSNGAAGIMILEWIN